MNYFLVYIIIILGVINIVRMSVFFIAGYIYDVRFAGKSIKKYYKPLVSVIISAYNEEKSIASCLDSVLANDYKKIEVVVVNDGSKDKTKNKVRKFIRERKAENIILVNQENQGKARALNNAIKNYSKGSLILTLDADSLLKEDAISKAVGYFKDKDVVALASNIKIINEESLLGIIQRIEYLMGYRLKKALTVFNMEYIIGGVAGVFRRGVLRNCHYYDTDTITEDIDLTLKIINKGNKVKKLMYASDVICYTQGPVSIGALFRQRFRWKFGRFQTLYKNKNLFFNLSPKYSKLLTCIYLPFILFSELSFLIDPILIGFVVYISFEFHTLSSFQGMFLFLGFYTFVSVISEDDLNWGDRFYLVLLSPLAYIFFFVISAIEYICLLKSIINFKGIVLSNREKDCRWIPVERVELNKI